MQSAYEQNHIEGESAPRRRRQKRVEKHSKGLEILEWVRLLFFGFLVAFLLRSFVLEFVRVDGNSMTETLQADEFVMITKADYAFDYPERGTIVICKYPGRDDHIVKRAIGLPGDTVEIKDSILYINDKPIDEPYVEHLPADDFAKTTVPQGTVFVIGDNREVSHDSRAEDVGPLPKSYIVGRARFVIWPLNDWRRVESTPLEALEI